MQSDVIKPSTKQKGPDKQVLVGPFTLLHSQRSLERRKVAHGALAHGLDRRRQLKKRIEHRVAAIHNVLRQRDDIGHGKDVAAGRDT